MIERAVEVQTATLVHAPWNPRESITAESVADLTASISKCGLLQAIGVWYDADDDKTYVIYGNRRFVAYQCLGMKTIPANIFTGVTKKEAKEITRIENEQRMGISPIKDAELVGEMLALGITEEEIAATFGVSVATVCRRAKLLGLEKEVVDFAKAHNVSADALERIALYPPEIQVDAINDFDEEQEDFEGLIRWGDLSWHFQNSKRILKNAPWAKDKTFMSLCSNCIYNTCCSRDLFGDIESIKNGEATCLDSKCYKRKEEEWRLAFVRSKVPDGMDIVMVSSWWEYGIEISAKVPSEENNVAYYLKWGEVEVRFAPSPQKLEEMKREREEARKIEAMKACEERKREDDHENKLNELLERFYNAGFVADKGEESAFETYLKEDVNVCQFVLLASAGVFAFGDDGFCSKGVLSKLEEVVSGRDCYHAIDMVSDYIDDPLKGCCYGSLCWNRTLHFRLLVLMKVIPDFVDYVFRLAEFTEEETEAFRNEVCSVEKEIQDEEDEDDDDEE